MLVLYIRWWQEPQGVVFTEVKQMSGRIERLVPPLSALNWARWQTRALTF